MWTRVIAVLNSIDVCGTGSSHEPTSTRDECVPFNDASPHPRHYKTSLAFFPPLAPYTATVTTPTFEEQVHALPPELFDIIRGLVFAVYIPYTPTDGNVQVTESCKLPWHIQINRESRATYQEQHYSHLVFKFAGPIARKLMLKWLLAVEPKVRDHFCHSGVMHRQDVYFSGGDDARVLDMLENILLVRPGHSCLVQFDPGRENLIGLVAIAEVVPLISGHSFYAHQAVSDGKSL